MASVEVAPPTSSQEPPGEAEWTQGQARTQFVKDEITPAPACERREGRGRGEGGVGRVGEVGCLPLPPNSLNVSK